MPKDGYIGTNFQELVFEVPEEWRKVCLIEKLNRHANSLDLNPLENVWKLLKGVVKHGET